MTICEFIWLGNILYVYPTFYHMIWYYYIIGLCMDLSQYV